MKAILESKLAQFIKECQDNDVSSMEIVELITRFLAGGSERKAVRNDAYPLFDGEIEVK